MNQEITAPEAEEALIGALLLGGEVPPAVERLVRPEMFLTPKWREVFGRIMAHHAAGNAFDQVILLDELGKHGEDMLQAMSRCPTHVYAESYAHRVRQEWQRRDLLQLAGETAKMAYDREDPSAVSATVRARLDMLDEEAALHETGDLRGVAERVLHEAQLGRRPGWLTGIDHIDRWTRGGLRPGQLYLIGGQTGIGKTMLISRMVAEVSDNGAKTIVFSLEMGQEEMFARLCAARMGAAALKLHDRDPFSDEEMAAYEEIKDDVVKVRVFEQAWDLAAIRAVTRLQAADVIVVDFVQNMAWPEGTWKREDQALDANMRGLALLARRANCAVIAVSQLNNAGIGIKPTVTAFRGSGGIPHVAHLAVILTRGEVQGLVTMHCVKNRQGPTGEEADYVLATRTGLIMPRERPVKVGRAVSHAEASQPAETALPW